MELHEEKEKFSIGGWRTVLLVSRPDAMLAFLFPECMRVMGTGVVIKEKVAYNSNHVTIMTFIKKHHTRSDVLSKPWASRR